MKIGCIIVLYNPNIEILKKNIAAVKSQVTEIWIGDNSPNKLPSLDLANGIYQFFEGNRGIAAAQNVGLHYFFKRNFDFIFFLDQDSIVEANMVQNLLNSYSLLLSKRIKVGGIGPRAINRQSNKAYVGKVKKGVKITSDITEVTEIISSASLIPVDAFKSVGLMESELFIDGVDHEWCWRARKLGEYRFFISERTHLSHQLGEGDKFFIIRKIAIPTPFRTYYQFRNYFNLLRRNYVPLYWKFANGFKYIIKSVYFPIFIAPRTAYFKNISKGIFAGLKKFFSNNPKWEFPE